MSANLRRDVRILQVYAVAMTVVVGGLAVAGFRAGSSPRQRFDEIDVERINVIEPDGTLRLVLSDKTRFPGLFIKGKEYPHPRGTAGLLFFNDEGTEDGGLAYRGSGGDSAAVADGELMFDQYNQDQTVGIEYNEAHGQRTAGLQVWDRPDTVPIEREFAQVLAIRKMPEGPERTRALEALRSATGVTRLFAGKTPARASVLALSDAQGHPRLRLIVEPTGDARIDFLDTAGRVTASLPSH